MVLLADALRISDRGYLFDNSATADDIAAAPRLVLQKTGPTPRNSFRVVGGSSPVAEFRLFQPIPAWVRDYAAKPLGLTN
jgi:hypothetical protein